MEKIIVMMVMVFIATVSSSTPAMAESFEVESRMTHEALACLPNGATCMGSNDVCCSGFCVSCGVAMLFCRPTDCQ